MVQRWQEASSRKVCLAVEDENELEHFLQLVQEASLPFAMIKDAGLTGVALEQLQFWAWGRALSTRWTHCFAA